MNFIKFERGTYESIKAISIKDNDTIYFCTDERVIYLGNNILSSNVVDANISGEQLVITKVGDTITVDFSDIASKTEVDSQLDELRALIDGMSSQSNLTILTTNDSDSVDLNADTVTVFNTSQTFTSKSFNMLIPDNRTKEYTWTLRFLMGGSTPSITFNAPSNFTIRWANSTSPTFSADTAYEVTFKYIPGVNLLLGVYGGF